MNRLHKLLALALLIALASLVGSVSLVGFAQDDTDADSDSDDMSYAFPGEWTVGTTYVLETSLSGTDGYVMRYEITEVTGDEVSWEMVTLDSDGEPMAGMDPHPGSWTREMYTPVEAVDDAQPADGAMDASVKVETLEAAGHSFRCMTVEYGGTTTSIALDYPGLIVNMESEVVTMELTEFEPGDGGASETDGDTDTEPNDSGSADDGASDDADDSLFQFPGRWAAGTTFVIRTEASGFVANLRYEITGVSRREVAYEMTELDDEGEFDPDAPADTGSWTRDMYVPGPAEEGDESTTEVEAEMSIVVAEAAGHSFECALTEAGGSRTWSALEYPGLLVRHESEYASMALVEFDPNGGGGAAETDNSGGGDGDVAEMRFPGDWTVGTTYTLRSSAAGSDSYQRYEITEVTDDEVSYEMTMHLANGGPIGGMDPISGSWTSEMYDAEALDVPGMEVSTTTEDFEAAGHTFRCIAVEMNDTSVWVALDYPGLVVSMESEQFTMELTDFDPAD